MTTTTARTLAPWIDSNDTSNLRPLNAREIATMGGGSVLYILQHGASLTRKDKELRTVVVAPDGSEIRWGAVESALKTATLVRDNLPRSASRQTALEVLSATHALLKVKIATDVALIEDAIADADPMALAALRKDATDRKRAQTAASAARKADAARKAESDRESAQASTGNLSSEVVVTVPVVAGPAIPAAEIVAAISAGTFTRAELDAIAQAVMAILPTD